MNRVIAWLLWLAAPLAMAQTGIVTLHYQDRPPYSSQAPDGEVIGLVATPVARAFRAAGIAFEWERTPSQRQLALIQAGAGLHCGVGWFRTEARAQRGRFSRPLYRDQPLGALVRSDTGLPARLSAATLLADRRFTLLVKEGYSYGPLLDGLIARTAARPLRTSAEPLQMGLMLRSRRADWMIVAPEEAGVLGAGELRRVTFDDVPEGPERHLYCSSALPAEWLARIDAALPPLAPAPPRPPAGPGQPAAPATPASR